MPFSCLPQLQHSQPQPQLPSTPEQEQQQQQVEVFYNSSSSQLAEAELLEQQLFAMPAVYQPRVKDLEAADLSGMLSGEDGLCGLETAATTIAVPVVEPVEVRRKLFIVAAALSTLLVSLHTACVVCVRALASGQEV
jgi:hypothetical protein